MESLRIPLGNLLDQVAARHPEKEALVDLAGGRRYSYLKHPGRID
jgi:hypothetical protein